MFRGNAALTGDLVIRRGVGSPTGPAWGLGSTCTQGLNRSNLAWGSQQAGPGNLHSCEATAVVLKRMCRFWWRWQPALECAAALAQTRHTTSYASWSVILLLFWRSVTKPPSDPLLLGGNNTGVAFAFWSTKARTKAPIPGWSSSVVLGGMLLL